MTYKTTRNVLLALLLLAVALGVQPGGLFGSAPAETVAQTEGEAAEGAHADQDEHADEDHGGGHQSPVTPVLLALVIMLAAAKLGGEIAERMSQPAVLGELLAGVVIGNMALIAGFHGFDFIGQNETITILAEIGVVLLLFEVGLESNIHEMLSVGPSSLLVALLGVVAPFFIGWGISSWLLPEEDLLVHLFIGATLCATSVGITARVLSDLGKLAARESKIILGAAVIDDVLGLVILAVVSGIITAANIGGELASLDIFLIIAKAAGFLVGAIVIGTWLSPRLFRVASKLKIKGLLLITSLIFCFALAYLANAIELAPIVGAFAAGLILEDVHYKDFPRSRRSHARGHAPPDHHLPGTGLLRIDGHPGRSVHIRRDRHHRLRAPAVDRSDHRQDDLRPGGDREGSRSDLGGRRHGPSWRGRLDLRLDRRRPGPEW